MPNNNKYQNNTCQQIIWQSYTPGVWQAEIGSGALTLTENSGVKPSPKLQTFAFSPCPDFITYDTFNDTIVLRIPLQADEKVFGIGLHVQNLICKNTVYHLRCDHSGGQDNGRTHAPVPFHLTTRNYGLFIDSPVPISYYIGTAQRQADKPEIVEHDRATDADWRCFNPPYFIEIGIAAESAKLVLFSGADLKDCVTRFNLYCGSGCLPPKWGLGVWHRTNMRMRQNDVMDIVNDYALHNFPLDVIGLEPGWQTASYPCSYEWSEQNFPQPDQLIENLNKRGIRVNLWENAFVSDKCSIYDQLLPYSGSHLVWCGIVPDYSLAETRELLQRHHSEKHLAIGVSGYKLDESDGIDAWLWPDYAKFPSGKNGFVYRSLCGLLFQRFTYEIYQKNNLRTYGLTRSNNAGGVSFPYVIYNDRYDFHEYLTALCSCGFIGVLWTPEVRDAKTPSDWLRRIQLAALSPLFIINAWANDATPWYYPEVAEAVRAAILLRQQLMPYLYNAFAHYHFDGVPPFRSVFLDYGYFLHSTNNLGELDATANPYQLNQIQDITDQFIVGDYLMVAPLSPDKNSRTVVFPPGKWYDFYSGTLVSDGGVKDITVADNAPIPLFAPDGAVIPMEIDSEIVIKRFGPAAIPKQCQIYDDDGVSQNYRQGQYSWKIL